MDLPLYVRVSIPQRAAFTRQIYLCGAGRAIDFTGCTAHLALRIVPDDATPLVLISTTPNIEGSIVLGTPDSILGAGWVQLNFTELATTGLDAPVVHGDLLVTWADGSGPTELVHIDGQVEAGSTY